MVARTCTSYVSSKPSMTRSHKLFAALENKDDAFMESLKARQYEINAKNQELENHWLNAKCKSSVRVTLDGDWVRRLDVDYPLVACGSASSNVAVHNIETGQLLASSVGQEEEQELDYFRVFSNMLYSGFDGGGTVAIAMKKNLICSSSRHGSVQVWRYDGSSPTLISQGSMDSQRDMLVTCLKFDEDFLWVGRADGKLQAFHYSSNSLPLAIQREPELQWSFGKTILSMALSPDIGYGVVTLSDGSIKFFSVDDDKEIVHSWEPNLESKFTQDYLISCAIVKLKENAGYSIICGDTDGSMYSQPIYCRNGVVDDEPFQTPGRKIEPKHSGPLKCLASPGPGLLVSGGLDGSIRLWRMTQDNPSFLYQVRLFSPISCCCLRNH